MPAEHIVREFAHELDRLNQIIAQMGSLAETQLIDALRAIGERDTELALEVIKSDARVDALEDEIDDLTLQELALRQPVAVDLRRVVGALRTSTDLERIADYATNIAKRVMPLTQLQRVDPIGGIRRMGGTVLSMVEDVLEAYDTGDAERAVEVWKRDEEVDAHYSSLFREILTYMIEDPRIITACTHLLFVAKNLERIGDHATNIAETVYFLVKGTRLQGARPKGDNASFAVIDLPKRD
jgi:phosphate transport system protein